MIIALASPRVASTLDEGLDKTSRFMTEASAQGAEIVCFPEAYLPGLRGQEFEVPPSSSTHAAGSRVARPRTSWTRAKTRSTCPATAGSSSRSMG